MERVGGLAAADTAAKCAGRLLSWILDPVMPKRAKEMIEEALRLAFLITAQCLREANELAQRVLWIIGHYRPTT